MNQEELGRKMNLSQAQISKYEQMEIIDDATLGKFSAVLGVPIQILKAYDHDATINKFITYVNTVNEGGVLNQNQIDKQYVHPLETVEKLYKEIISLTDKVARLEIENEWLKKKND